MGLLRGGLEMRRIILYSILIFGSVIFALPFFWLVLTTFKGADELTGSNILPLVPYNVMNSPYVGYMVYPEIEKPTKLDKSRWNELKPKLEENIWEFAYETLGKKKFEKDYDYLFKNDEQALKTEMTEGLWQTVVMKLPESIWKEKDDEIIPSISKAVNSKAAEYVFKQIFKGFAIKNAVLEDREMNIVKLKPKKGWVGDVTLIMKDVPQGTLILYDFGKNKCDKEITAEFQLPVSEFNSLGKMTISFDSDTSFNKLFFEIRTKEGTYITKDPVIMEALKDTAVTLCLGEPTRLDSGDIVMEKSKLNGNNDDIKEGEVKLKITLKKIPFNSAVFSKFTKSYRDAMKPLAGNTTILDFTFNSIFLAIINILGQVFSCTLIAYAFARIKWPGRDVCFVMLLATMMLPSQVTMIPIFAIFAKIGWYDTLKPLWIPSFFGQAFYIFLLRQFFMTIPRELDDAAKIDGCTHFGIYSRILLPQMKPALATITIFTFMGSWNNFIGPLIYLSSLELYPLALGLSFFRDTQGSFWGLLMAASTLMILPIIIVFFFAQKYFIQGTTLTGMKG